MISVLFWLWSTASGPPGVFQNFYKFGPQDVMRLAVQVRANLKMPHRLVVISDLPAHSFCSELEHVDLVTHFGELRRFGGCWLRLKCFAPELEPVLGPRWAWLDLDSLVVGSLDPLLDRPEPLVLYRSDSIAGQNWNGSFVLGGVGNEDIWSKFDPETAPAMARIARLSRTNGVSKMGGPRGTDQSWLHLMRGPETPHVSASDGVLYWRPGSCATLPSYARMVVFAGAMKLSNWKIKRYSPWVRDYYPGVKIDPAQPLPAGLAIEPIVLPKQSRRRSLLSLEREARKIRGGREFAKA